MRSKVSVLIILVLLVGLFSRSDFALQFIPLSVGDALYGTLIYFLVCWIRVGQRPAQNFLIALSFCFVIEFSQLITVDWFETIRNTLVGKLILGNDFKLSDLIYLSIGVTGGLVIDRKFLGRKTQVST